MALPSQATGFPGIWAISEDQTTQRRPSSVQDGLYSMPETPLESPSELATPAPLISRGNDFFSSQGQRAPVETLGQVDDPFPDPVLEMVRLRSQVSHPQNAGLPQESGSPTTPIYQGMPKEFNSLVAEIIFVLVCAAGQVLLSLSLGHVTVTQGALREALGIQPSQAPWLIGSLMLSSGLSVIIAGSLADLAPPKPMMTGAFLWVALWNLIASFFITPERAIGFFVARALVGLAVGVTVSASMSILGRIYQPGLRKNRVFSLMSAGAPLGFWIGCVQGGALSHHLPWIFRSTALLLITFAIAAQIVLPPLTPAKDSADSDTPSLRQFDYLGAVVAALGCGLILFGLTQGSSAHWNPYTYSLIIVGFLMFVAFYFIERSVSRPLIPNGIWKTPGFAPLLVGYFLGFGAYSGAWQFYAIQFWQRYQGASPLTTALYILPNGIVGVLAAWIVSKTLHRFPGHWIFMASMISFALGPAFFLAQTPDTPYWALSMPGVALATFGPDLSFAAAAVFITSNVPRSYQGSAGSLLVTVQTLTSAIITSVSDSLGVEVDQLPSGEIGLNGLRAIWWYGLASALVGAIITAVFVRIPKSEEKEHVQ